MDMASVWWRSDLRRCDGSSLNDWIDGGVNPCGVAAVTMADADCRYVGLVLEQPCLQDLSSSFEGRTVR